MKFFKVSNASGYDVRQIVLKSNTPAVIIKRVALRMLDPFCGILMLRTFHSRHF